MKKSGIKINPAHKGEFTARAKKAGKSVQAEAKAVLASPTASPKAKKQANFARNAKKWERD